MRGIVKAGAPIYDAHNHLQDARLAPERAAILASTEARRIVVNGTREGDWEAVLELARSNPLIVPSLGLHPWHAAERSTKWLDVLKEKLSVAPSAIGEIGLDRWMKDYDWEDQQSVFLAQLQLAAERHRPATLHCLQAWGALLELLRHNPAPACGFLLHSYGGPLEMVDQFAELGGYFSFCGYFAHERKARQQEVFRVIPLERLLVETDAPDMPPPPLLQRYPLASGMNHPGNITAIYEYLAQLRGIQLAELAMAVEQNFLRLFAPVLA